MRFNAVATGVLLMIVISRAWAQAVTAVRVKLAADPERGMFDRSQGDDNGHERTDAWLRHPVIGVKVPSASAATTEGEGKLSITSKPVAPSTDEIKVPPNPVSDIVSRIAQKMADKQGYANTDRSFTVGSRGSASPSTLSMKITAESGTGSSPGSEKRRGRSSSPACPKRVSRPMEAANRIRMQNPMRKTG